MNQPIVITGAFGLLGWDLPGVLEGATLWDVMVPPAGWSRGGSRQVDLTRRREVESALASFSPGAPPVVVHLAGLTDTAGENRVLYDQVNVEGSLNVWRSLKVMGGRMIHVSTDYVFGAEPPRSGPFLETDQPKVCPASAYAASKWMAERQLLEEADGNLVIVRLAFPFGTEKVRPGLFRKTLQRLKTAEREKPAPFFADQWICPTYIPDIHRGLKLLIHGPSRANGRGGLVVHLVGARTTPFDFAREVCRQTGLDEARMVPASVQGTRYAQNLWLSSEKTEKELGWSPTPLTQALKASTVSL